MRPVKTSKSPLKLVGKEYHIATIGLRDQSYTFNGPKIKGFAKTYSYTMPGISAVSD
jgi:hypothetical protein